MGMFFSKKKQKKKTKTYQKPITKSHECASVSNKNVKRLINSVPLLILL